MRVLRLSALSLLTLLLTSGCIEMHLLLSLKPDGSGTIRETVLMNSQVIGPMREMAAAMQAEAEQNGTTPPPPSSDPLGEEQIRNGAERFGSGVQYVSHELIDDGEKQGYRAVYSFSDINAVRTSQNPTSAIPEFPGDDGSGTLEGEEDDETVTFAFTPGAPARLVITPAGLNDDKDEVTEDPAIPEGDADFQAEAQEMAEQNKEEMKQLFRGMRVSIAVQFEGDIVRTNANFREGNTVTVIDVDFDALLDNEEALSKLERADDLDPEEIKALMRSIPGIRFETEDSIEVLFR